jgi:hypothetical protein
VLTQVLSLPSTPEPQQQQQQEEQGGTGAAAVVVAVGPERRLFTATPVFTQVRGAAGSNTVNVRLKLESHLPLNLHLDAIKIAFYLPHEQVTKEADSGRHRKTVVFLCTFFYMLFVCVLIEKEHHLCASQFFFVACVLNRLCAFFFKFVFSSFESFLHVFTSSPLAASSGCRLGFRCP